MGGIGDLLMLHRLPAEGPDDPDAPQPLAHQLILPINVGIRLLPQGEDLPADEDDDDNLENEDDNLDEDDDENEDEAKLAAGSGRSEGSHKINVDVELSLNCNQNISLLFSQKKDLQDKLDKTVQAAQAAVAEASKQRQTELRVAEAAHPAEIARQREKRWFEKFDWCVTTDGFIVLAGRSGEQNEILVRRYLRPGDLFVALPAGTHL